MGRKAKTSDGTEHGAHVLFTQLIRCELDHGVVYVTGRSNNYERSGAMTIEYTKLLYQALGRCLAEAGIDTGVVIEGVEIKTEGDKLHFVLKDKVGPCARGVATIGAVQQAVTMAAEAMSGRKVVRLKG